MRFLWVTAFFVLLAGTCGTTILVAPVGGDFTSVQPTLDLAMPGDVIFEDTAVFSSGNRVLIKNRSRVTTEGYEIRNLTGISDGSGIRVLGAGSGVRIRDREIHNILGQLEPWSFKLGAIWETRSAHKSSAHFREGRN